MRLTLLLPAVWPTRPLRSLRPTARNLGEDLWSSQRIGVHRTTLMTTAIPSLSSNGSSRAWGGIVYGSYTGRWFDNTSETDIEHIVARSEAHDSGLCDASAETRRRFATDLLNLTLVSPEVNRSQKSGKDASEWLPELNRCWFASRVVEVRREYALSVDEHERDILEGILSGCTSTEMVVLDAPEGTSETLTPAPEDEEGSSALELYDDNGNGRITCAEARNHGIAPVRRGHLAYEYMNDADADGVVCE